MTAIRLAITLTVISLGVMRAPGATQHVLPDHLLPVDFNLFPTFRAILAKKLCPTPFDFGRVVIESFLVGEESLAIYSRQTGVQEPTYYVTYMAAAASLRDSTQLGHDPKGAGEIRIRRIDAKVSKQTAELVKQVWIQMLSETKAVSRWERSPELVFGDAANAEFSIQMEGHAIFGRTVFVQGGLGKQTKELVGLVDLLRAYCKAEPVTRPAIATKIDRKTTRLLEILKRSSPL